jgi:hypothetical protein
MGARRADWSVPEIVDAVSGGHPAGKIEVRRDWQNLSIGVPESVILEEKRVIGEVTIPQNAAENTMVPSGRTSDFRHLGLWP